MVSQVDTSTAAGGRRRRNRRGEGARLRSELIEAARRLLATAERESDLSIRAVTRAAGAAPQSFYLQFANLSELLYAVYSIEFEELRQVLADAAGGFADPVARLTAVCAAYCAYAGAHPARYRVLTGVTGQAHDEWAAAGRLPGAPAFALLRESVAAALAERQRAAGRNGHRKAEPASADDRAGGGSPGLPAGPDPPDGPGAPADLLAAVLWAALHGIVTLRADRPAFPWPPVDDMLGTLIERLVTAEAG
jgi:AcrR family transcriptional regulator